MKRKTTRLLALVISIFMLMPLLPATAFATDSPAVITDREAEFLALLDYDHAESLARYLSEEIGNRITYSPRRDMAADWIMDEFESYGYEPYIQEFTLSTSATINGLIWIDGKHYTYYGPTRALDTVYKYDDRASLVINGAAALNWPNANSALVVPDGAGYSGKAVFVTIGGTSAATASNYYNAALALQNAGAAAVIFQLFPAATNGNTSYTRIGNTATGTALTIPVGTTLNYETAGIISSLNEDTEILLNLYSNNVGKNIIAALPSESGSNKTVYVTSHFDTTGSGPGMNDNAVGVAMTLEMARAFKDWEFDYNLVLSPLTLKKSACWALTHIARQCRRTNAPTLRPITTWI